MAKIFLTGATGYVGGDFLYRFAGSNTAKHVVSALVRDSSKAEQVSKAYPDVRIVLGDLDDAQLIEDEARKADIVIHLAATKHIVSSKAIQRGLTEPAREKSGYWIQISGATNLAPDEIKDGKFGFKTDKVFDDVKDLEEIIALIQSTPSRDVDNLVLAQDGSKVKTAWLDGPHIYGTGRGTGNRRTVQATEITRVTLELKEGFRLNDGRNSWSYVHVHDLSDLFVSLVDAAAASKPGLWNKDGIYFAENGALEFGELSAQIAAEAHKQGLIPHGSVKKVIDAKEADSLSAHASILWGTNAVERATRARTLLGWKPSRPSLVDDIPEIVRRENEALRGKL